MRAPQDLQKYLETTESVSSTGHPYKGEGMDAQLEEVNKASKVWEHGATTAKEWLTIMTLCGIMTISVRLVDYFTMD